MKEIKVDKFKVHYLNKEETLEIKKEIFALHTYYFETDNPTPFIIDAGAQIGMSTLYFKKQYPAAEIIAIEPNTINFKLLEENIWENQLDNVTTIQAALTGYGSEVEFHADEKQSWLSTASIHERAWNGDQDTKPHTVPAIQLNSLITRHVDLHKLDIEGAEQQVLVEAKDKLSLVKKILFEFHPHPSQSLLELQDLLTESGFTVLYSKNGGRIKIHQAKGLVMVEATRED
jgi:FkbM family methyltransferase